jgi:hypothetical protein
VAVILSGSLQLSGISEGPCPTDQAGDLARPCYSEAVTSVGTIVRFNAGKHRSLAPLPLATLANTSGEYLFNTHYVFVKAYSRRRIPIVKPLVDISLHDLAVMLGTGSFTGAVISVLWDAFSASPAPSQILVATTLAGFLGGRLLSHYSERAKNDA